MFSSAKAANLAAALAPSTSSSSTSASSRAPVVQQHTNIVEQVCDAHFNLPHVLSEKITSSQYFATIRATVNTYAEIIDEWNTHVKHIEPYVPGRIALPSTAFCLLYKMCVLRLTHNQIHSLLSTPSTSPLLRAAIFLYLRLVADPKSLWDWFSPYLDSVELFNPAADPNTKKITMGAFAARLLTDNKFFSIIIKRVPVPIERQFEKNLQTISRRSEQQRKNETLRKLFVPGFQVLSEYCENGEVKYFPAKIDQELENGKFLITFDGYANQEEVSISMMRVSAKDGGDTTSTSSSSSSSSVGDRGERKDSRQSSRSRARGDGDNDDNDRGRGTRPRSRSRSRSRSSGGGDRKHRSRSPSLTRSRRHSSRSRSHERDRDRDRPRHRSRSRSRSGDRDRDRASDRDRDRDRASDRDRDRDSQRRDHRSRSRSRSRGRDRSPGRKDYRDRRDDRDGRSSNHDRGRDRDRDLIRRSRSRSRSAERGRRGRSHSRDRYGRGGGRDNRVTGRGDHRGDQRGDQRGDSRRRNRSRSPTRPSSAASASISTSTSNKAVDGLQSYMNALASLRSGKPS